MIQFQSIKNGFRKGVLTLWDLAKITLPVYILVSILQRTSLLDYLVIVAKPLMSIVGLPGEAATPIVIGNVLNIYAAIGAIGAMELTTKETTIIALMILISHNLFVETAISKKSGVNVTSLVLVRIIGSFMAGMALNWGWTIWNF